MDALQHKGRNCRGGMRTGSAAESQNGPQGNTKCGAPSYRASFHTSAKADQGKISGGSISRIVWNTLFYMCTNFGAFMQI